MGYTLSERIAMQAFHIISTAPYFAKHDNGAYSMDKFELYSAAVSALNWRSFGGKIILAADTKGEEYIRSLGISALWNEIRTVVPDDLEGIDPIMFWAAGKLFALREITAPAVMMDTDFIAWKAPTLPKDKIVAAHREDLNPSVYPSLEYFRFTRPFSTEGMNTAVLPLNTAFLYIPDESFKQYYVNRAIAFMKSAYRCGDNLRYMVFAEQRLLAICAEEFGIGVETLMNKDELFFPRDDFTHLWGAKQVMRNDTGGMNDFCRRARERIKKDYPDYEYMIPLIESSFFKK